MRDLFEQPPVAGLCYREEFIDSGQEESLIHRCEALDLTPFRFQGWEGKRLTRSFGWHYDFDERSLRSAEAIPDWLLPVRRLAAVFAGLDPDQLVHALIVRYDPGAGIGWHRDRPLFDRVVGLSLETPAVLRLRRRRPQGGFDRARLRLQPRSAYLLAGEVRQDWEHSIAPGSLRRFSITFRSLSSEGRRAGAP